jgi:hypothetical protein
MYPVCTRAGPAVSAFNGVRFLPIPLLGVWWRLGGSLSLSVRRDESFATKSRARARARARLRTGIQRHDLVFGTFVVAAGPVLGGHATLRRAVGRDVFRQKIEPAVAMLIAELE